MITVRLKISGKERTLELNQNHLSFIVLLCSEAVTTGTTIVAEDMLLVKHKEELVIVLYNDSGDLKAFTRYVLIEEDYNAAIESCSQKFWS